VLLDMETLLRRLLGEDVEVSLNTARSVGMVYADPSQLEQIIMNLAVNARDAMPRGGKLTLLVGDVEVDASTYQNVAPGPYVLFKVTDTGDGMDEATREHIFEPFFTTKESGTGLGLSTVFGIVQQSHGHIVVDSSPGQGTTFNILFPRTDLAMESPASPPRAIRRESRGTETVLLVEDDEQVRALNCIILRRAGYQLLQAASGDEALVVSEKFAAPIDLLLTDVVMPRMSGRELADRLRSIRPNLKVLYLSGYTRDIIAKHGVLETGVAFLEKPVAPAALVRKVQAVLSQDC
jgi:two-component system cell cycle sensor histidine kinase/response regulator CckA